MLKETAGSAKCILGVTATGTVTDDDYKSFLIPRLETIITKRGKARLLFNFDDMFHGYELAAMWDDATFGLKHKNDFEKCAVVGGPKWVEWGTNLEKLLIKCEVKVFRSGQLQDAWNWIRA